MGIPATKACRALRYHGHALVDCLGSHRAYGKVLPEGFHFGSASVTASIHAIHLLREALRMESKKKLLRLKADEEGIAALTKAVPDLSNDDAEALLYGYAASGQADLIKILLEAGVSVNAQRAKDGCSALHIAHFRKSSDVVALLEAHGADATLCNVWGETAEAAGMAS